MRVLLLIAISLLDIGVTLCLGQGQTGDQLVIRSARQNPHQNVGEKLSERNSQYRIPFEFLDTENEQAKEIANLTTKIEQMNVQMKNMESVLEALRAQFSNNEMAIKEMHEQISAQPAKAVEQNRSGSCYDVMQNTLSNGVYNIVVSNYGPQPIDVYCKYTADHGTGWTVVLRRIDGSENFDRYWTKYKNGFGNPYGEFFIGLDKLHAMTTAGKPQELLILLRGVNSTEMRYAQYDEFAIGDENEAYKLNVLGNYTGDAGDSLRNHLDMKFSTKDVDNDRSEKICATSFRGGWWFNACYRCHLTGRYLDKVPTEGVAWNSFPEETKNMMFAEMMIRTRTDSVN